MTDERNALRIAVRNYGNWLSSLEYVVVNELKSDLEKLNVKLDSPNTEDAEIGASILAFGLRLNRVQEKLEEVDNAYRQLLKASPNMVEEGKRWLQGK